MDTNPSDVPELLARIVADVKSGEVIFPSTTEMALKIQRVIDDPDCALDDLAHLVQAEPLLAARVVAVANSVIYNRSGQPVGGVRNAIARIGLKTLRVLAASVVVREMERMAGNPEHARLARRLWERTAHVAALATLIARRVAGADPDAAFFAGIVHEVGGFYLIARADEFPELLDGGPGSLEAWRTGGEAELGGAVLRRLNVPAPALEAVEALWRGDGELPPHSVGDILQLAWRIVPVDSPLAELAGAPAPAAPAEAMIGDATLEQILAESEEEVASLIGALYD